MSVELVSKTNYEALKAQRDRLLDRIRELEEELAILKTGKAS